ncbi:formate--tetrahydrofolate ligase [Vibrio breoganii]|uniref:formate--tetrahydrofolate ligase n=1 Tax=Vibrio breoganii TaxID=553239 RepID=UPI000C867C5E|nr:formate--tetrahydrofolate ligase [Vibrio breoganii]PMM19789.1 formate--tetrahydrofolate ligase [Vibrio breoganii]
MLSDIEISNQAQLMPIQEVAKKLSIGKEHIKCFGDHIAKVKLSAMDGTDKNQIGKLVFVTAMTPTQFGEGKTVTSVGLAQGLDKLGYKAAACLRQPSMGPIFGLKGGAAGGGYSQVIPMDELNLHCTGDIHAITSAHNLAAAALDARLYHEERLGYVEYEQQTGESALKIDKERIVWTRAVDHNDRALRMITVGKNQADKTVNGIEREDGFVITAASELMAIMSLSVNLQDMRDRIGRVILAYSLDGLPITAEDVGVAGAMAVIMKDVIEPTLMQTNENVPVFIHGGPFANIAHGNSSIVADEIALRSADFVITESGFGSDMGFEKACNIKIPVSKRPPNAVVIVATIKAIKAHSSITEGDLKRTPSLAQDAICEGFKNLEWHIENVLKYGVPVVVAINRFEFDSEAELRLVNELISERFRDASVAVEVSSAFSKGGAGAIELAKQVAKLCSQEGQFTNSTNSDQTLSMKERIIAQAKQNYDCTIEVGFTEEAELMMAKMDDVEALPLCFAKAPNNIFINSIDGRPYIEIKSAHMNSGAGFIYLVCGTVMKMPGLGLTPAFKKIDLNTNLDVIGLD